MREMALFAAVRLALWAAIWWVLTLFDIGVMLAGVLAALIAMLISILFLSRIRSAAALRWKAADDRRHERKGEVIDEDAEAEDASLDEDAEPEPHPAHSTQEELETADTSMDGELETAHAEDEFATAHPHADDEEQADGGPGAPPGVGETAGPTPTR